SREARASTGRWPKPRSDRPSSHEPSTSRSRWLRPPRTFERRSLTRQSAESPDTVRAGRRSAQRRGAMFQVIPRELAFFDLFDRAAAGVEDGAKELLSFVDDLPSADAHAARIEDLEHAGDDITHEILALLNTTFVVPIDRHDIHGIASSLDDVLDHIDAIADLIALHEL